MSAEETPAKPRKDLRPIRLSYPAWDWIKKRAREERISAPEFIRGLVNEARVREQYDGQVIGRLTTLEERVATLEAKRV